MIPLVNFDNLPDNINIKLKGKFKTMLFIEFYLKFNNIEKCIDYLNCSIRSFYNYKHQYYYIPAKIIRKMAKLCNISNNEIDKNILSMKKRNGISISLSFPLYPSSKLASIIGHTFGDGHITSNGRVSYVNKDLKLIQNFELLIKNIFRTSHYYMRRKGEDKKCFEIRYPSIIGELLARCGAIKGNKIEKEFDVPYWIKNGSPEIKSAFIRSIFDDEGHVSNIRRKHIRIKMAKMSSKVHSLKKFFLSIKKILSDIGVDSNKILDVGITTNKNGETSTNLLFFITKYQNLKQYYKNVGFNHPIKYKKLNNILNSYTGLM